MPIDPAEPPLLEPGARVYQRLSELERRLGGIETWMQGGATAQVPVVAALPAFGREGRVLKIAGDNRLWVDTGTAWVAV